jgi:hypothetical protein
VRTEGLVVLVTQPHSCNADPDHVNARIVRSRVVAQAAISVDSARNIVAACLEGASDGAIAQLPRVLSMEQTVCLIFMT